MIIFKDKCFEASLLVRAFTITFHLLFWVNKFCLRSPFKCFYFTLSCIPYVSCLATLVPGRFLSKNFEFYIYIQSSLGEAKASPGLIFLPYKNKRENKETLFLHNFLWSMVDLRLWWISVALICLYFTVHIVR